MKWLTILAKNKPRDPAAPLLVWHRYQKAMVIDRRKLWSNPYYTHFREIDPEGWIRRTERLPGAEDADQLGCVLARDVHGEVKMAGWRRFQTEDVLEAWQAMGSGPEG